jgi:uncharacterized caspase-like protein
MEIYRQIVAFSIFLFCMSALLPFETEGNRGVIIQLRKSEGSNAHDAEEVQLYSSSHALVIGIDDDTGGWPRLSNAVRDAKLVADVLANKGFSVTLKTDLGSKELETEFSKFFIFKGENPQARLFVWFAGHGHTLNGHGFLVPADAPKPNAEASFKYAALSMWRFGEYMRLVRANHVFAVFDSCFSGTIFTTRRSMPPAAVTLSITMPVRQFLSSGDENQEVSDDGTFRKLFVRAIKG